MIFILCLNLFGSLYDTYVDIKHCKSEQSSNLQKKPQPV
nr:MAG TPA: hypothetical protein [Caudoviricetes sp.]